MEWILASQSPRRKELLAKLPIAFTVLPSPADEILPDGVPATEVAAFLAVKKAAALAALHPEAIVIGADTTVLLEDCVLGKPRDHADCVRMLQQLSGRSHTVHTGVAIFWNGKSMSFSEETTVQFYPLSAAEIAAYADTDEPYDKAGGYAIQGQAGLFVAGIHGNYDNVVGLPTAKLYQQLKKIGLCG